MDTLHNLLLVSFEKEVTIEKTLRWIIVRKLKQSGIELSDEQLEKLTIRLEDSTDDTTSMSIDIDLNDDELDGRIKAILERDDFEITDEDVEAFDIVRQEALETVFKSVKEDASKHLLGSWAEIATTELAKERKKDAKFNKTIYQIWGNALEKLRMLLRISLEAGETFNDDYRVAAVKDNDTVFEALVRLHARGCQVGHEILVLLTNGLADGALARWRTLHEIAITAEFIKKHGQDVANRYLLHQVIDNYKGMEQFQKHHQKLGMKPYSVRKMRRAKHDFDKLIAQFGGDFKKDYGWASDVLNKSNPGFPDIEADVGLEWLHPYVKLAHHHVHATSRGSFYPLAFPQNSNLMAAGPSIHGLYEPGVQTSYSTTYLLSTVLLSKVTLDHIAFVQATMHIEKEVRTAFADALKASEAAGE